ncbi:MAG: VWA domain-containing protein [Polyangia bacterium]
MSAPAPRSPSAGGGDAEDDLEILSGGQLAAAIVRFARLLRGAGLKVGPSSVLLALEALTAIDLSQRDEVRAALRAVLVQRAEDLYLFEQAFALFFRPPGRGLPPILDELLANSRFPRPKDDKAPPRRLLDALRPEPPPPPLPSPRVELSALLSPSSEAALRGRDFAELTAEELEVVRRLVARLPFALEPLPTRRTRPARYGPLLDLPRMLRASLRTGGTDLPLRFRAPRQLPPPLCVLCDISGSMGRYTEMLLRFLHTLQGARRRTHTFLFGTELSNVTRALRGRDIDAALRRCGAAVRDFGGGTRLGRALHAFNNTWSRRVLGQGAVVLLITDGLERDTPEQLDAEAARLARSCRRLVWLNPLLSFEGFTPRAQGVRALLKHVHEHRPVHNLLSLEQLAAALSGHPRPTQGLRGGGVFR